MANSISIYDIDLMPHRMSQINSLQVVDVGGFDSDSASRGQLFEPTFKGGSVIFDRFNCFQVSTIDNDFGLGDIDTNNRLRSKDCHVESSELGFKSLLGLPLRWLVSIVGLPMNSLSALWVEGAGREVSHGLYWSESESSL
jgi:hypothetical protein